MPQVARRYIEVHMDASRALRELKSMNATLTASEKRLAATQKALAGLFNVTRGFVGGFVVFEAVQGMIELGDAAVSTQVRLEGITGSAEEARQAFDDLLESANRNGVAVDKLAESFVRVQASSPSRSYEEILDVTDLLAQAIATTGADAQQAGALLLQFAQGLGAGALQGDEFKSVIETSPKVIQAWARAIGLGDVAMRDLSEGALLTTDSLFENLKAFRENLVELTGLTEAPLTVAKAFTVLRNEIIRLFTVLGGEAREGGALQGLSGAILGIAEGVRTATPVITGFLRILGALVNLAVAPFAEGIRNVAEGFRTLWDVFLSEEAAGPEDFIDALGYNLNVRLPSYLDAAANYVEAWGKLLTNIFGDVGSSIIQFVEVTLKKAQVEWARFKADVAEASNTFLRTSYDVETLNDEHERLAQELKDLVDITDEVQKSFEKEREELAAGTAAKNEAALAARKLAYEQSRVNVELEKTPEKVKEASEAYTKFQQELSKIGETSGAAAVQLGADLDLGDVYLQIQQLLNALQAGDTEGARDLFNNIKDALQELAKNAGGLDLLGIKQARDLLADIAKEYESIFDDQEAAKVDVKIDKTQVQAQAKQAVADVQATFNGSPVTIPVQIAVEGCQMDSAVAAGGFRP